MTKPVFRASENPAVRRLLGNAGITMLTLDPGFIGPICCSI